jgi:predicted negative regulator of RcsB-dependent stress response
MSQNLPVILIEVVLIFGGVLAFGWWQLRDIRKAQEETARQRAQREAAEATHKTEGNDATC